MKKYYLIICFIFLVTESCASTKEEVIKNLKNIDNLTFRFEQNIKGKIETGNCIIQYPKKIMCKYTSNNQKVLVSNGNSLVIKTLNSYYIYPLNKTPLNFILNKEFLLNKVHDTEERIIDNKFINYNFFENENEINIFFDKNTYDLIGWQILDIYQNLSITYLSNIQKNQDIKKNLFKLPKHN